MASAAFPKKIHCEVVSCGVGFDWISGHFGGGFQTFQPVWVMSFDFTFYNSSKNKNRVNMGLFTLLIFDPLFFAVPVVFVFQLEIYAHIPFWPNGIIFQEPRFT